MESLIVIAIISILFLIVLRRLWNRMNELIQYKRATRKVTDCLSRPHSMMVNSGGRDIRSLTCIQGSRYEDIVDKYRLGHKACPIQKCIEDNVNFRLMVNAFGEQVCLSASDSSEVANDVVISSLAKDCLVDDNGLPDVTKSFVVDSTGIVGCIDNMDIVSGYLNSMSTSTPISTSTPSSTPTATPMNTSTPTNSTI
jgi:type II secretory pathway pseudopilin PulG